MDGVTVIPESALTLGDEIGQGAFGIVRRAKLGGLDVCVKVRGDRWLIVCYAVQRDFPRRRTTC